MGKFKTGGYEYCATWEDAVASKKPILTDAGYNKIVLSGTYVSGKLTLPGTMECEQLCALIDKGVEVIIEHNNNGDKKVYRLGAYKLSTYAVTFVHASGSDIKTATFSGKTADEATISTKSIPAEV